MNKKLDDIYARIDTLGNAQQNTASRDAESLHKNTNQITALAGDLAEVKTSYRALLAEKHSETTSRSLAAMERKLDGLQLVFQKYENMATPVVGKKATKVSAEPEPEPDVDANAETDADAAGEGEGEQAASSDKEDAEKGGSGEANVGGEGEGAGSTA